MPSLDDLFPSIEIVTEEAEDDDDDAAPAPPPVGAVAYTGSYFTFIPHFGHTNAKSDISFPQFLQYMNLFLLYNYFFIAHCF